MKGKSDMASLVDKPANNCGELDSVHVKGNWGEMPVTL